jgi:hypothetical protein
MPANWDATQYLTNGRVEWPMGDITGLNANEVPMWVDAWVVQGGGDAAGQILAGPSQSSSHSPSWSGWGTAPYNRWMADVAGWANGTFQAGQAAMGISVLATREADVHRYEWWFEVVILQNKA